MCRVSGQCDMATITDLQYFLHTLYILVATTQGLSQVCARHGVYASDENKIE